MIGMAVAQLVLSAILLKIMAPLLRKPIGLRLVLLSIILIIQSLSSIIIYTVWKNAGYGAAIARPLLIIQSSALIGTIILIDIVRR